MVFIPVCETWNINKPNIIIIKYDEIFWTHKVHIRLQVERSNFWTDRQQQKRIGIQCLTWIDKI
jgi:hypothetical protein